MPSASSTAHGACGAGAANEDTSRDTMLDANGRPGGLSSMRKMPALRMWIPDTIVYGETGQAIWIYSDKDGFVQRLTDFGEKQVLEKLGNAMSETERAIVYKEPVVSTFKGSKYNHNSSPENGALASMGNQLRLLNSGEVKTLLNNGMASRKSFALQQFVKCSGSKAFIVRSVHEAGKPASAWMISNTVPIQDPAASVLPQVGTTATNATGFDESSPPQAAAFETPRRQSLSASSSSIETGALEQSSHTQLSQSATPLVNRLCTSIQVDKSCTFVKLNERGCASVSELNRKLVKYVEQRIRIQLQTLVADYTKDATGQWWLLQVKAFRVKNRLHPDRNIFSLSMKTRIQYLSYRDSSVLEVNSDSEDDDVTDNHGASKHCSHAKISLAQRQVRKLVQCKCCLASYPKSELSFKMTLKMINETLVRIRARLPPEKNYTFLCTTSMNESPDASLAYESWSVCSFCYAIYERDQQLKRIEVKFSAMLGVPNPANVIDGLSSIQGGTYALDPNSMGSILPPQLTLCRLVLVFNAIYDIPKELYDAEQVHFEHLAAGARKNKMLRAIASKLYLRITALGYTECVALRAEDIEVAQNKVPRGAATLRKASTLSDFELDEASDQRADDDSSQQQRNYWLPINLIRTIHFFAPRTPLQSKLKDTSGIAPLLNEENSILVHLIRATEPPLQDPTTLKTKRTKKKRRAALIPEAAAISDMVSEMQMPHHSVMLGSTRIRLAQFRSAYVTKIDFYACMALSGELFNIKGNIGLERLRYVDTKFLTSQYRLRMYNGVFIPDDSYTTNDPLSPEWMDSLRISFHKQPRTSGDSALNEDADDREESSDIPETTARAARHSQSSLSPQSRQRLSQSRQVTTKSTASLISTDNEEMDEELEHMIDLVDSDQQQTFRRSLVGDPLSVLHRRDNHRHGEQDSPSEYTTNDEGDSATSNMEAIDATTSLAELKQQLLPTTTMPSRYDAQISMLLKKSVLSPRSAFAGTGVASLPHSARENQSSSQSPLSPRNRRWLWCLVILLNEVHNLQSREHSFCRWECHYTLLGQKRSAVERNITSTTSSVVHFTCTHKFFVAGTSSMMQAYLKSNQNVTLHLRNDMYASTRSHSQGEFQCTIDLSGLQQTRGFDATINIHPTHQDTMITPREAAAIARAAPYMSISVHLSQLNLDPDDATVSGNFLDLSRTEEGLQVLRKNS
uniref:Uncharacterized protein n=1 Tax=Globisporangium ultimum (strain ATCC 200006 / CBS 805.95 / DAOM BR144) TaxID=431595 RepID=K3WGE3_GLOUD